MRQGAGEPRLSIEDIFRDLPTLETERLILRRLTLDDAPAMFDYASDPEVARYMEWEAHRTVEDSRAFILYAQQLAALGKAGSWGIELRAARTLAGGISLDAWHLRDGRAEIAYAVARRCWNQGLMTEAVREVVAFGFRGLGLNRIEARVSVPNAASARVLEKAGFRFEGLLRQHMLKQGVFHDMRMYGILRGEYDQTQRQTPAGGGSDP